MKLTYLDYDMCDLQPQIMDPQLFEKLQKIGWSRKPGSRYVALLMYESKVDTISVMDYGPEQEFVLTFSVQYINTTEMQPLGCVFYGRDIEVEKIADALTSYIKDLIKCECFVVATLSNVSDKLTKVVEYMIDKSGYGSSRSDKYSEMVYSVANLEIVHLFDPVSLIENVRDLFWCHDIHFRLSNKDYVAKYSDLVDMLKDEETPQHVKNLFGCTDPSNASYAIWCFSQGIFQALLDYAVRKNVDVGGTPNLIHLFDIGFDTLSGHPTSTKLNRSFISSTSPHFSHWSRLSQLIRTMYLTKNTSRFDMCHRILSSKYKTDPHKVTKGLHALVKNFEDYDRLYELPIDFIKDHFNTEECDSKLEEREEDIDKSLEKLVRNLSLMKGETDETFDIEPGRNVAPSSSDSSDDEEIMKHIVGQSDCAVVPISVKDLEKLNNLKQIDVMEWNDDQIKNIINVIETAKNNVFSSLSISKYNADDIEKNDKRPPEKSNLQSIETNLKDDTDLTAQTVKDEKTTSEVKNDGSRSKIRKHNLKNKTSSLQSEPNTVSLNPKSDKSNLKTGKTRGNVKNEESDPKNLKAEKSNQNCNKPNLKNEMSESIQKESTQQLKSKNSKETDVLPLCDISNLKADKPNLKTTKPNLKQEEHNLKTDKPDLKTRRNVKNEESDPKNAKTEKSNQNYNKPNLKNKMSESIQKESTQQLKSKNSKESDVLPLCDISNLKANKPNLKTTKPNLKQEEHNLKTDKPDLKTRGNVKNDESDSKNAKTEKSNQNCNKPNLKNEMSESIQKESTQQLKSKNSKETDVLPLCDISNLKADKPNLKMTKPNLKQEEHNLKTDKPDLKTRGNVKNDESDSKNAKTEKSNQNSNKPNLKNKMSESIQKESAQQLKSKNSKETDVQPLCDISNLKADKPNLKTAKPNLKQEEHNLRTDKPDLKTRGNVKNEESDPKNAKTEKSNQNYNKPNLKNEMSESIQKESTQQLKSKNSKETDVLPLCDISNLKADKPNLKTDRPNLKTDKPNLKTGKPNLKTDKANLKTGKTGGNKESDPKNPKTEKSNQNCNNLKNEMSDLIQKQSTQQLKSKNFKETDVQPLCDISNLKTDKPNLKTEKPNLKTEKPNLKTEKPNLKTEKPNVKTEKPKPKANKPNVKTDKPDLEGKNSAGSEKTDNLTRRERLILTLEERKIEKKDIEKVVDLYNSVVKFNVNFDREENIIPNLSDYVNLSKHLRDPEGTSGTLIDHFMLEVFDADSKYDVAIKKDVDAVSEKITDDDVLEIEICYDRGTFGFFYKKTSAEIWNYSCYFVQILQLEPRFKNCMNEVILKSICNLSVGNKKTDQKHTPEDAGSLLKLRLIKNKKIEMEITSAKISEVSNKINEMKNKGIENDENQILSKSKKRRDKKKNKLINCNNNEAQEIIEKKEDQKIEINNEKVQSQQQKNVDSNTKEEQMKKMDETNTTDTKKNDIDKANEEDKTETKDEINTKGVQSENKSADEPVPSLPPGFSVEQLNLPDVMAGNQSPLNWVTCLRNIMEMLRKFDCSEISLYITAGYLKHSGILDHYKSVDIDSTNVCKIITDNATAIVSKITTNPASTDLMKRHSLIYLNTVERLLITAQRKLDEKSDKDKMEVDTVPDETCHDSSNLWDVNPDITDIPEGKMLDKVDVKYVPFSIIAWSVSCNGMRRLHENLKKKRVRFVSNACLNLNGSRHCMDNIRQFYNIIDEPPDSHMWCTFLFPDDIVEAVIGNACVLLK